MDAHIQRIAEQKSEGSRARELVWQRVLERLVTLNLDEAELNLLASACHAPQLLNSVKSRTDIQKLFAAVDDSAFTLETWFGALDVFYAHTGVAEVHGIPPFSESLSYLSCCSEAMAMQDLKLAFPEVVREMLDVYGYAGAAP